ncbi:MAG: hypothetical protein A3K12_12330 [Candidatus Rokubacteria bacterium RIFCSPLOWO2_12_FULL_71_19]|nr:MAG: hypothetical protein A3K12_12330 [Candidatus Rokubacteria bacterium RIFCSPLOWO2_12_FULL_71_19]
MQAFREWKTGSSIQQNQATHRLIADIRALFGFDQFDINASPDNQTLQLFINGRSFRLHELGGGLAQFIIVFANVAAKQPTFILIDEPELNLHPSLQLKFLSSLTHYAGSGILFATHSLGLARSSADQIYTFRKLAEGESKVTLHEAATDLPTLLNDLTFSGYRELAFDKLLLVEGPTDLPTFRQFLRRLRKDQRIVVFPLGGDAMITGARAAELEELKRISPALAAVIDSEKTGPDTPIPRNRLEFQRACAAAGVQLHILERRAIENYFPATAVRKVKGDEYAALAPYQTFQDLALEWSKDDNWRVAYEMTKEDLLATDLGQFLDSL